MAVLIACQIRSHGLTSGLLPKGCPWLKHQAHICRDLDAPRGVTGGIINENEIQACRIVLTKIVEKALHHRRIERRKFHTMVRSGERLDRAEAPCVLEVVLVAAHRLHPTGGQTTAPNGVESKAALVTGPDAHRELIVCRNRILSWVAKLASNVAMRSIFFGCDGRGTLSFAPSV